LSQAPFEVESHLLTIRNGARDRVFEFGSSVKIYFDGNQVLCRMFSHAGQVTLAGQFCYTHTVGVVYKATPKIQFALTLSVYVKVLRCIK